MSSGDVKTEDPAFAELFDAITGAVCKRAVKRLDMCVGMLNVKSKVSFFIHCDPPHNKPDLLDFLALTTLAEASGIPHTTESAPDGSQHTVHFYRNRGQTADAGMRPQA